MTTTTRIKWALSGLALAGLMACSGGGNNNPPVTPPPAKTIADRLDYVNPASGTYTLVRDASSTSTHLVLNLMGPAGAQGTGVGFYLSADSGKVTWSKPSGSDSILAHNGVFDLGASPQLAIAKATGDQIQVGFYQKGTTKPAVTFTASTVLASVAVDLKPNVVPLGAVAFSAVSNKAVLTNGSAAPAPIVISVGTLTAN